MVSLVHARRVLHDESKKEYHDFVSKGPMRGG